MMMQEDLVFRLRKRAEIRRQISTRKSVQEGKPDRIADLLEEAADEIQLMRDEMTFKNLTSGAEIMAGDGGYGIGTQEKYDEFVKNRNYVTMKKLYVLVGVPGAGKSTWVKSQDWLTDVPVVSTDNFVEEYALSVGKTYNEVFKDYMPTAVKLMTEQVIDCRKTGKDIVWDQTSTSIASRKKKFVMLPDYYKIAVVFKTPPEDELKIRLASRPGKNIPDYVMRSMIDSWEDPTEEEGFDEIWYT